MALDPDPGPCPNDTKVANGMGDWDIPSGPTAHDYGGGGGVKSVSCVIDTGYHCLCGPYNSDPCFSPQPQPSASPAPLPVRRVLCGGTLPVECPLPRRRPRGPPPGGRRGDDPPGQHKGPARDSLDMLYAVSSFAGSSTNWWSRGPNGVLRGRLVFGHRPLPIDHKRLMSGLLFGQISHRKDRTPVRIQCSIESRIRVNRAGRSGRWTASSSSTSPRG